MCAVPAELQILMRTLSLSRPPRATLSAVLMACAALISMPGPALASWMVPPAPDRPKDFTMVKRNGLYHLFYIRNNLALPFAETQVDFGHATSPDLYFWQQQPAVLSARPGHFDQGHVWAPSIVLRDGIYYMFYTGVADSFGVTALDQRMGLATSTDLFNWNPLESPVFTCEAAPWTWCDSLASSPFRDPFVMPDPTTPGRWLMYYATAPASDPNGMVVGVAASDGDFTAWQDAGPLWITHHSYSYNDVIESPHLFQHNGLWYLFFTTNSGQPISFATGANPLANPVGWTYRGRLSTMLGYSTQSWFASEYFRDGLVDYFGFINGDRVEIDRMSWQLDYRFSLVQPDLFHVQNLTWLTPSVRVGQEATLYITSKWWNGRTLDLETYWVDDSGSWHPVADSALGIPNHIPLYSDIDQFTWVVRALPPELGAGETSQIVVRLVDQTCTSNLLQILPQAVGNPGLDPPPEAPPDPNGAGVEELYERGAVPKLRTLRAGIFGSLPSMRVDLPEEQAVRLDVFDLQGRRVRTIADRRLPAGASVLGWDGRDASGVRLARGVYFARLTTPATTRSTRILLR